MWMTLVWARCNVAMCVHVASYLPASDIPYNTMYSNPCHSTHAHIHNYVRLMECRSKSRSYIAGVNYSKSCGMLQFKYGHGIAVRKIIYDRFFALQRLDLRARSK